MQRTHPAALLSLTLALSLGLLLQPGVTYGAPRQPLWQPPLGSPFQISAPYDLSNGPFQAGHRGIDMRTANEAQVLSPTHGIVSYAGMVVDRPVISIRVDTHTVVSLEPVTTSLKIGDAIARGDPVGTVASGGHCANECLHLGVRVNGAYVNPMRFLVGRAKLIPW